MPLKEGSSREAVGQNIETEMQSGKPQAQALAIALKEAGLSNKDEGQIAPEQVSGPDDGMDAKKPAREPDRAEVERIYQAEGYEAAKKAAEEMGILWYASSGRTASRDYSGDVASSMGGLPQTISHAEMAAFASNFNYNQKR